MKIVIQRVKSASVTVKENSIASIEKGMLILLGIETQDTEKDIDWLVRKACNLRIFDDENGVMNRSLLTSNGQAIVVSQFTLHASTKKGNRPSYTQAARPELALSLYKAFVKKMEETLGKTLQTGEFGAMMDVSLCNDGPVTIIIDSKNRV